MKKTLLFYLAVLFIITACSADKDQENGSLDNPPELLEVSINTPEKIEINQEITIKAKVTQGEKEVTKADEVKFEIWKSGQDDHETVVANNEKDGNYSIKKTFHESGNYFIVAHTTANRMHSMPKKEVVVLGDESEHSHAQDEAKENHDQHADQGHNEHHTSEVTFDFHAPSTVKSSQPVELSVKISQGEQLISAAGVRFEIWEENETKHQFIEAKEVSPGTYSTNFTFAAGGHYHLKIHVEKEHIHDHTEKSIEVTS